MGPFLTFSSSLSLGDIRHAASLGCALSCLFIVLEGEIVVVAARALSVVRVRSALGGGGGLSPVDPPLDVFVLLDRVEVGEHAGVGLGRVGAAGDFEIEVVVLALRRKESAKTQSGVTQPFRGTFEA